MNEVEVRCIMCGDVFVARHSNARCCSGRCRMRRWRARHDLTAVDVPKPVAAVLRRNRTR